MKKMFLISFLFTALTALAACGGNGDDAFNNQGTPSPGEGGGGSDTRTLVAYFSAQGHTQAVAERIAQLTGADIHRIEAAEPYASNPYDDSDRIQREAYNDLRPAVANLLAEEEMAKYDTIYVGTPTWWHQPAMVVCTFLEAYDLSGKVIIPFATYGATTYLNETLQKLYKCTPNSIHIPATLPKDIDPDDIQHPQSDDAGIDQPGNANGVEAWLRRMGLLGTTSAIASLALDDEAANIYYTLNGMRMETPPTSGVYISNNRKFLVK